MPVIKNVKKIRFIGGVNQDSEGNVSVNVPQSATELSDASDIVYNTVTRSAGDLLYDDGADWTRGTLEDLPASSAALGIANGGTGETTAAAAAAALLGAAVTIGADADGTDRSITFGHTTNKCIMGIDDDQDVFAIHTAGSFASDNDFEMLSNGKSTFAQLTVFTSGIQCGANASDKWSDGYHGNKDFIPLVPADFTIVHDGNTYDRGYISCLPIASTGAEATILQGSAEFMCQKTIPKGFTATGTLLYGDSWSGVNALTAYAGSIVNDSTNVQLFLSAKVPTASNSFDGSGAGGADAVVGDGLNYVTLIIAPAAVADTIHGGKILIERTSA